MQQRFRDHKKVLRRGIHHSRHLQNAWNKYGEGAFNFMCLEEVSEKEKLIEREQAWLDFFRACDREWGYNIAPTAGSALGVKRTVEACVKYAAWQIGRKLTHEHRANLSLAQKKRWVEKPRPTHTTETREKLRLINTGKKHSAETRAKLSRALLGNKNTLGYTPTAETRAKLAAALMGNTHLLGHKHTAETRAKMSLAHSGITIAAINPVHDSNGNSQHSL